MKKILLTGGGTAGHVTPNIALFPALRDNGYELYYIGSKNGIEKELLEKQGIPYYGISSGKLRRYLSAKNISDTFRVCKGVADALAALRQIKPDIIFSKGGFVTVPVVIAGWLCRVPIVIHESDITPGLANRISLRFASAVCVSFSETAVKIGHKSRLTGSPIRREILSGDKAAGLRLCGFTRNKPVLLAIGGSLGSKTLNSAVRSALPRLCESFNVVHICGNGSLADISREGYAQFEYLQSELRDVFAACDIIVSRAGANALFEIIALKKPNLLIPLSKRQSRGDQIENARSFEDQGYSAVLQEEELNPESLVTALDKLYKNREAFIIRMSNQAQKNGISEIMKVIREFSK